MQAVFLMSALSSRLGVLLSGFRFQGGLFVDLGSGLFTFL